MSKIFTSSIALLVVAAFTSLAACSRNQKEISRDEISFFFAADGSFVMDGERQPEGGAVSMAGGRDGITLYFETEEAITRNPDLAKSISEPPKPGIVYEIKDGVFQPTSKTIPN